MIFPLRADQRGLTLPEKIARVGSLTAAAGMVGASILTHPPPRCPQQTAKFWQVGTTDNVANVNVANIECKIAKLGGDRQFVTAIWNQEVYNYLASHPDIIEINDRRRQVTAPSRTTGLSAIRFAVITTVHHNSKSCRMLGGIVKASNFHT